jgi:hypothetical protein
MTNTPNAEETWWDVTYPNGSILTLPAPSQTIGDATQPEQGGTVRIVRQLLDPAKAMTHAKTNIQQRVVSSYSHLTKKTYAVDLADAVCITVRTFDPERIKAALLKARQSHESSSTSGRGPASPSDDQENPSGRSIGARIRRPTRH